MSTAGHGTAHTFVWAVPCEGEFGAGEEIRTPDPRITNALLYQLSYPGEGAEV